MCGVLFILENFYGIPKDFCFKERRLKYPAYPATSSFINMKNATYSRIVPYFKNTKFNLYFSETTAQVANDKNTKFPVDYDYIKTALNSKNWFAVVPCCKKATDALNFLGIKYFHSLPHPVSFKWRKILIEELINKLNKKYNEVQSDYK